MLDICIIILRIQFIRLYDLLFGDADVRELHVTKTPRLKMGKVEEKGKKIAKEYDMDSL